MDDLIDQLINRQNPHASNERHETHVIMDRNGQVILRPNDKSFSVYRDPQTGQIKTTQQDQSESLACGCYSNGNDLNLKICPECLKTRICPNCSQCIACGRTIQAWNIVKKAIKLILSPIIAWE